MVKEEELKFPGDELAMAEEFSAGEGAFEDDGVIRASVMGKTKVDTRKRAIALKPLNYPPVLKVGDEVIGVITGLKSSMVTVDVIRVAGEDEREIPSRDEGTIHISKISDDFVSDTKSCFKQRDVIKAKVIQVKPSLQLSTSGRDLGVIQAYCSKCREKLKREGGKLKCASCQNVEERKLSSLYGSGRFS
jgi:exosome complex component CSL4